MRTYNLVLIVESKRQPETPQKITCSRPKVKYKLNNGNIPVKCLIFGKLICCKSKVKSPMKTKGEDTLSD